MKTIVAKRIINEGKVRKQKGPMLNKTEWLLQDLYHPFISRFVAMLNDKVFLWADVKS